MKTQLFISVAATLLLAHGTSADVDPLVAASPFGGKTVQSYSSLNGADIPWSLFKPNDFGPRVVTFDSSGARTVRPAPAAGAHPRIFFGPDDLPEIRARLKETKCGRIAWNKVLSWSHSLRGDYDGKADYAQPDLIKGDNRGTHGHIQNLYYNDADSPWKPGGGWYKKLVAGDKTADPSRYWPVYGIEALRCLIENDAAGARDLAAAVTTSLQIEQAKRDADPKRKGKIPDLAVDSIPNGIALAYVYDFIHQWLTPTQRAAMCDELCAATWHHDNYGTFTDAEHSSSNWATFSYWMIQLLAIEGEPGFNDLKLRGFYRGWRNFLTYGYFASGAIMEGEAKGQLGMDGVMMLAMRDKQYGFQNLAGHPHLRAYATNFLPHSIVPFGGDFVAFDLLGGAGHPYGRPNRPNGLDLLSLKYLYPDDKTIDWAFRNHVGDDYSGLPRSPDGYFNPIVFYAIFASDFDEANSDPTKLKLANTFFDGERALLLARSGWDKDATLLGFHVRQVSGGHAYADRNAILLAGKGRWWSCHYAFDGFDNFRNSLVVVDGMAQDLNVPGRMVDFVDAPLATFAVGDAKYAWDWNWSNLNGGPYKREQLNGDNAPEVPGGWEKELHGINDFRFVKREEPFQSRPLWEESSWILPAGYTSPVLRRPNYPVQRAFRTVGIVRGKYPYALVLDDIQKDNAAHHYDWVLSLEPDVQLEKLAYPRNDKNAHLFDVLLTGTDTLNKRDLWGNPANGEPLLLVRVLERAQSKTASQPVGGDAYMAFDTRRLVIPSDSVAPNYKVLLYPYRQGDPTPVTTWDDKRSMLVITIGAQKDTLVFAPAASGKTSLTITRDEGGKTTNIIEVKRAIAPLN